MYKRQGYDGGMAAEAGDYDHEIEKSQEHLLLEGVCVGGGIEWTLSRSACLLGGDRV